MIELRELTKRYGGAVAVDRLSFQVRPGSVTGLLTAEWVKLRSVRSTAGMLVVLTLSLPLAALIAWGGTRLWDSLSPARRAAFGGMPLDFVMPLVCLAVAVLGVLAITSEYTTGTIGASLAAEPRRVSVLAAKSAVVAACAVVATELTLLVMHVVTGQIVGGRPMPGYTGSPVDQLRPLLAAGAVATAAALVGLGLGALLRSTAAAIVVVVVLVFVLPASIVLVPPGTAGSIAAVMLTNLAPQLAGTAAHAVLSPWQAGLAIAAYVAMALGGGALVFMKRDA